MTNQANETNEIKLIRISNEPKIEPIILKLVPISKNLEI